jgi:hypothetical protein
VLVHRALVFAYLMIVVFVPLERAMEAQGAQSSSGTVASPGPAPTTIRQFGAWLDDASALPRARGYVSIGAGEWRMLSLRQTNVPMLSGGIGITDRLQVAASVPFYHYRFNGAMARGIDDIYVSAKYNVVDPTLTLSEVGLSISPALEVLSADVPGSRVHLVLPVNLEFRRSPYRVYGSAGYFTRGSVFSGSAIEWRSPKRILLIGAITQSYSVKRDRALDELSVGRHRVDAMVTAVSPVWNRTAVYVSLGRSLSSVNDGGTKLARVAGITFGF